MNKNNTKQKLIEAMYELIAKEGYEKASINKVCTLAGVKKPTFYHYFNSKEEVFINIIKETYPSDFDDILNKIKSITSVEDYKKAIDLAPSIKPFRHTYLHEEQYRELAKQILVEDDVLRRVFHLA